MAARSLPESPASVPRPDGTSGGPPCAADRGWPMDASAYARRTPVSPDVRAAG